jgi:enoyl-CoA hydratase/carnithine racemase
MRGSIGWAERDRIAIITIDGVNQYNFMSDPMISGLIDAFRTLDARPDLHAAVLAGGGGVHFSAGGDLKEGADDANRPNAKARTGGQFSVYSSADGKRQERSDYWFPREDSPLNVRTRLGAGYGVKTPVVAAINGACLGGALMVLSCHTSIRIAGDDLLMCTVGPHFGLAGGGARFGRQVAATTEAWLAAGEYLDAGAALRAGLVNEVVPAAETLDRAIAVAQQIASNPRIALAAEKRPLMAVPPALPQSASAVQARIMMALACLDSEAEQPDEDLRRAL